MTITAPITLPAPVTIDAPLTFGYLTPPDGGGGEGSPITFTGGFASTVTSGGATIYWPASTTPPTP